MTDRTWHVTAEVVFPNHIPLDVDENGRPQPPKQLTPQSRIPTAHRQIDGADVFIYEGDKQSVPQLATDLRFAVAHVAVRRDSHEQDPTAAIQEAVPLLDRVLESLSFQLQYALQIHGIRAIDLTGEPSVGDQREFAQWSEYSTPTFRPTSVPMQSLVGRLVPNLNVDLDPSDARANRALDWYLKALLAPFEADHFIFLWIGCEILAADTALSVSEPYTAPHCGHLIKHCPECGKTTSKPVQGQSMKLWLTERFGIAEDVAGRVWKARQMLHGAYAFDSAVMDGLPELSQTLRAAVVTDVKHRLGLTHNEPPFAYPSGLTIAPHVGLSGTSRVTDRDLHPVG